MKKILILLTTMLLFAGCSYNVKPESPTPPATPASPPPKATFSPDKQPSESLSLEEKVGQLFMVRGDTVTDENINNLQPGGIVMFESNFSGLTKKESQVKIYSYKNSLKVNPFIAVDEEGGTVVRVSSNTNLAPEKYKSPQDYYNEGGIELVLEKEKEKSEMLLELGVNMNLAPVSDVAKQPTSFIYDRTLGKDAKETAKYIEQVVSLMNECNIASSLKHFPGYGDNLDTHIYASPDYRSLNEFRSADFLPFTAGINAGADSVMISHNIIMEVDSEHPASLSKPVHDLLRNELGFEGIIITDDMAMAAAKGYKKPYATAILAGNDMIIVDDFVTAYNEVLEAVKNGEISEEQINASVDRIINAKIKRGII